MLTTLLQNPVHPYEIARTLRSQGKDTRTKTDYGSLYTFVQNLGKHGLVEVAGVERQGNRPERTVYGLTGAGREEMAERPSDLAPSARPSTTSTCATRAAVTPRRTPAARPTRLSSRGAR